MKTLLRFLRFALIGWLAGAIFTLGVGLLWPAIFPGIVNPEHYFAVPSISLPATLVVTVWIASLFALLGGLIGGILPREGGSREQNVAAALGGIILSIPFGCFNYWMLSGA
jgi:hypothetical protein